MEKKNVYVAPCVKAVAFRVEQGFAGSQLLFHAPENPNLEQLDNGGSIGNTTERTWGTI